MSHAGQLSMLNDDSISVSSTWELTSVSMRYSQGDGVNTSLSSLMYCAHVLVFLCVLKCLLVSLVVCDIVLPAARSCAVWDDNNKDNVCTPTIPAGLKRPPPSKTTSPITRFGTLLNNLYRDQPCREYRDFFNLVPRQVARVRWSVHAA